MSKVQRGGKAPGGGDPFDTIHGRLGDRLGRIGGLSGAERIKRCYRGGRAVAAAVRGGPDIPTLPAFLGAARVYIVVRGSGDQEPFWTRVFARYQSATAGCAAARRRVVAERFSSQAEAEAFTWGCGLGALPLEL